MDYSISLKFGVCVRYRSAEVAQILLALTINSTSTLGVCRGSITSNTSTSRSVGVGYPQKEKYNVSVMQFPTPKSSANRTDIGRYGDQVGAAAVAAAAA